MPQPALRLALDRNLAALKDDPAGARLPLKTRSRWLDGVRRLRGGAGDSPETVEATAKGCLGLRGLCGLGDSVPAGYQKAVLETALKSPADWATIRERVGRVEAHGPALDTLIRPKEIAGTVTVKGALPDTSVNSTV